MDQERCLTQHDLNNGLLGNPDYPREMPRNLKQAAWGMQERLRHWKEESFDFYLEFFYFIVMGLTELSTVFSRGLRSQSASE